jgi:hypothetical protein
MMSFPFSVLRLAAVRLFTRPCPGIFSLTAPGSSVKPLSIVEGHASLC